MNYAETCDRIAGKQAKCRDEAEEHRAKIEELEEERKGIATDIENIRSLPQIAQKYEQIEEYTAHLAFLKSVVAKEEQELSTEKKKELEEKNQ